MTPYTIVLADDHAMLRRGVRKIIEEMGDLRVVGEAGDGLELLELLKQKRPDLVILDISMPNLLGLEAARKIKESYPGIKVLLLTMHKKKDFLQQGLEAGVDGFLVKEDADTELVKAVQTIRQGGKFFSPLLSGCLADLAFGKGKSDPLSRREREIAKLLAEGKSNKEIASLLCISVYTVRRHRDNIMRKLHLKSLADVVRYALEQGYTSVDS
jgi:DNA-binding NarL/FixJ family response regulator|uniref:Response regulator transcription factor n=1 Tax=Desulfobacca acetoxidans TaxID=60893 RepID=A0A7C3UZP1_9BACT